MVKSQNLQNDRTHPLMKLECITTWASLNVFTLPSISLSKKEVVFLQNSNLVYIWFWLTRSEKNAIHLMPLIWITFPTQLLICNIFLQLVPLILFSRTNCAEDIVEKAQVTFCLRLFLDSAKVDTLFMATLKKAKYCSKGYIQCLSLCGAQWCE